MKKFWQFNRTVNEKFLEQFDMLPTDKYNASDFPHSKSPIYGFVIPHDAGHLRVVGEVWSVEFGHPSHADTVTIDGVETAIFIHRTSTSTVELIKKPTSELRRPAESYASLFSNLGRHAVR